MIKEWLLMAFVTILTLLLGISIIRWYAPGLLGIPVDLQMVQSAKEVPPFFRNVFRRDDYNSQEFLIQDPEIVIRGRPHFPDAAGRGPHDLLGFRNRNIPIIADVISIGDSQTYGNMTFMEYSWPGWLQNQLPDYRFYNMALGGWGAVQYLTMFRYVFALEPQVLIVAFYTGNDPIESFKLAYGGDQWKHLRPDDNLKASDVPNIIYPTSENEKWKVTFKDGVTTVFTARYRNYSNMPHPATDAGWEIMLATASEMAQLARETNVRLIFTIIPTKEYVYADKVSEEDIKVQDSYQELVENESKRIDWFSKRLQTLDGAQFIDVIEPLQNAASGGATLYPVSSNGHPVAEGNRVIAEALKSQLRKMLPDIHYGLVVYEFRKGKTGFFLRVPEGLWFFGSEEIARNNGWDTEKATPIGRREILGIKKLGVITDHQPERFGPERFNLSENSRIQSVQ